jgi:hypothetical protein
MLAPVASIESLEGPTKFGTMTDGVVEQLIAFNDARQARDAFAKRCER